MKKIIFQKQYRKYINYHNDKIYFADNPKLYNNLLKHGLSEQQEKIIPNYENILKVSAELKKYLLYNKLNVIDDLQVLQGDITQYYYITESKNFAGINISLKGNIYFQNDNNTILIHYKPLPFSTNRIQEIKENESLQDYIAKIFKSAFDSGYLAGKGIATIQTNIAIKFIENTNEKIKKYLEQF